MRGRGLTLIAIGLALAGLSGCALTKPEYRPPKEPPQYVAPPVADSRYSEPPQYPKGALNKDAPERAVQKLNQPGSLSQTKMGMTGSNY